MSRPTDTKSPVLIAVGCAGIALVSAAFTATWPSGSAANPNAAAAASTPLAHGTSQGGSEAATGHRLQQLEAALQAAMRQQQELQRQLDGLRSQSQHHAAALANQAAESSATTNDGAAQERGDGSNGPANPEITSQDVMADPSLRHAYLEQTIHRATSILETHFEDDPVEPAWAEGNERAIANAVAQPAYAGVSLGDSYCKSRVCRVELTFDDLDAVEAFVAKASTEHPWKHSAQMVPATADDELSVVMYLAREGHDLPAL